MFLFFNSTDKTRVESYISNETRTGLSVQFPVFRDENTQAAYICKQIRIMVDEMKIVKFGRVALLCRTNEEVRRTALKLQSFKIPVRVVSHNHTAQQHCTSINNRTNFSDLWERYIR